MSSASRPSFLSLGLLGLVAASLAGMVRVMTGCACVQPDFTLVATIVDGPTGQFIPMPSFSGVAQYGECDNSVDGAGGGAQNPGPCMAWIVHAPETGGKIIINAADYESQTFDVPDKTGSCDPGTSAMKVFRLKRK